MKKYIQPSMDVIDMETSAVIATSFTVYEESSDLQLQDRKRGEAWSDYEGN